VNITDPPPFFNAVYAPPFPPFRRKPPSLFLVMRWWASSTTSGRKCLLFYPSFFFSSVYLLLPFFFFSRSPARNAASPPLPPCFNRTSPAGVMLPTSFLFMGGIAPILCGRNRIPFLSPFFPSFFRHARRIRWHAGISCASPPIRDATLNPLFFFPSFFKKRFPLPSLSV